MYLKLKNINKAYDDKIAVDSLSLDVPPGVIYGIIGPNGAGKTTTIRMIMDITAPDTGEILFEDKPITSDFKSRVGYLPEERGLYKKMAVDETIIYMSELKGQSPNITKAKMDQWLTRMNLLDYKKKKVEELSKGMQQKLQFITTIIHDPDIVILDELFSGLDPLNIEIITSIILDLKRAGKTILFSTHVMEQAEKLCDYICMISNGKKVIDGKLIDVKANFGRNSLQINIDGDGAFMRNLPGVNELTEFNNYIELRLGENADPNQILRSVLEKVNVSRFEIVEPSLYDIFIKIAKVDPSELSQEEGGQPNV